MRLIVHADSQRDIFVEDLIHFEKAILQDSNVRQFRRTRLRETYIRIRRKWSIITHRKPTPGSVNKLPCGLLNDPKSLFMILMGPDRQAFEPYSYIPSRGRLIYMFDAWPKNYKKICRFVNEYHIDKVFVSASQSAAELNKLMARDIFHYVPEGVDPILYRSAGYDRKDIDVFAMGRKYDDYHAKIKDHLEQHQRKYFYEIVKGKLVFPDRNQFIDGLSRTKISICVPSSITHPERSGHVETMTMRYLQSMASKCLIVGHAPKEMVELFGYRPVIEIDWEDPSGQIESLLHNYHLYIPLIERNHREIMKKHTWAHRFEQIKDILCGNAEIKGEHTSGST
jgi:hypothetical protein